MVELAALCDKPAEKNLDIGKPGPIRDLGSNEPVTARDARVHVYRPVIDRVRDFSEAGRRRPI